MTYADHRLAPSTDAMAPDHWPACPRCGDLCEPDSVVCVECGTRLMVEVDEENRGRVV